MTGPEHPAYWRQRWARGETGWHLDEPNPWLVAHASHLPGGGRVLVPLCGRSRDLAWLARAGWHPVGIEVVEDAARGLFRDARLVPTERQVSGATHLEAGGIEVWVADVFELAPSAVGPVDAWWDRAALVALPAFLRGRYAERLRRWLRPEGRGLLVTLEHDEPEREGPPFSVSPDEVVASFAPRPVRLLGELDLRTAAGANATHPAPRRAVERLWLIDALG
ncbi:MAG: thiopurine S-methyltransferase [Myxococcota bacterium]|nr:thiopurine S-methyltransferase [Myxococcota bacterium]MDW8363950.1 hypothetical protein [Myxococcales bacterium]